MPPPSRHRRREHVQGQVQRVRYRLPLLPKRPQRVERKRCELERSSGGDMASSPTKNLLPTSPPPLRNERNARRKRNGRQLIITKEKTKTQGERGRLREGESGTYESDITCRPDNSCFSRSAGSPNNDPRGGRGRGGGRP